MNAESQIQKLESEIANLRSIQSNCRHQWGQTVYNPEKYRRGYGSKFVGRGSDHWTEYEGYEDAYKDRWSRTCQLCGKIEYTYTQETVQVITKPKF